MKKVSIIITAYNCEKTIEKAINSCLHQTLDNIEIIIVDDGSNDSTSIIANNYSNTFSNVYYYHKENGGVFSARNYGLSKVNGEYFIFLDSDDYFDKDTAKQMYEKGKENNSDLVYSNFYYTYPNKEKMVIEPIYKDVKSMMINMYSTLWNKLFKTETIKKIGVNFIDCTRYEDTSFLYKTAPFISRIDKIDSGCLHYVQNNDSLVHRYDLKVLQIVKVLNDLYYFYKQNEIFNQYYSELEYITIRYTLGQPYKYCCRIKNKKDRDYALEMLWNHLNKSFPNWRENIYLKKNKSFKNIYFRLCSTFLRKLFAFIIRVY